MSALGSLPSDDEKVAAVRSMFDTIAPRYDLVNRLMTFGLDVWWRKRTVDALGLAERSRVADVGCGTGDLCRELQHRGYRPIGVDLSMGMLRRARTTAPLLQADGTTLPVPDATLDGVTSGFALRNVADLDALVAELARVLRPGGRIALLEVDTPTSRWLGAGHQLWFRHGVPLLGRALSDGAAYRYLPQSVAYLPPAWKLRAMVKDAGFSAVNHRSLSGGVVQLITATRRGRPGGTR